MGIDICSVKKAASSNDALSQGKRDLKEKDQWFLQFLLFLDVKIYCDVLHMPFYSKQ